MKATKGDTKMKTKTINVYSVNELSDKAKQRAFEKWCQEDDYPWNEENSKALRKFEEIFPVDVRDFEYGYRKNIDWKYTGEENIGELNGSRLATYIQNHYGSALFRPKYIGHLEGKPKFTPVYSRVQKENSCVLTGYYIDNSILGPIYEFLKKPTNTTFKDLLGDCLESWLSACENDYEGYFSLESFLDHAEANEYEFDVDGNRI